MVWALRGELFSPLWSLLHSIQSVWPHFPLPAFPLPFNEKGRGQERLLSSCRKGEKARESGEAFSRAFPQFDTREGGNTSEGERESRRRTGSELTRDEISWHGTNGKLFLPLFFLFFSSSFFFLSLLYSLSKRKFMVIPATFTHFRFVERKRCLMSVSFPFQREEEKKGKNRGQERKEQGTRKERKGDKKGKKRGQDLGSILESRSWTRDRRSRTKDGKSQSHPWHLVNDL